MVDYVHILFDRHQVVFSEGLETESFLPGPQIVHSFEADVIERDLAPLPGTGPRHLGRATALPRGGCCAVSRRACCCADRRVA